VVGDFRKKSSGSTSKNSTPESKNRRLKVIKVACRSTTPPSIRPAATWAIAGS